jgi:hypothetical protein
MGSWVAVAGAGAGVVALAHGQIEVTPIMAGSAGWWAAVVGVGVVRECGAGGPRQLVRGAVVAIALVACAVMLVWRVPGLMQWERGLRDAWKAVSSEDLERASERLIEASRLHVTITVVRSEAIRLRAHEGPGSWHEVVSWGQELVTELPGRVEGWVALANVMQAFGEDAIPALERGATLDPWSVSIPIRLADAHAAEGDHSEAARWARKALENDGWLRLDPVVRMDGGTLARMEALAAGGGDPEPGGEGGAGSALP